MHLNFKKSNVLTYSNLRTTDHAKKNLLLNKFQHIGRSCLVIYIKKKVYKVMLIVIQNYLV